MNNIDSLVLEWKQTREEEKLLKMQTLQAKDCILQDERYNQEVGLQAREKYKHLYSLWQDCAERLQNIEQELEDLGYNFDIGD